MKTYETSATVEESRQIHVAGVPFAAGTSVTVTIREKAKAQATNAPANLKESPAHMKDLFARVRARNTESVGPLNREELYDRKVLR